VAEVGRNFGFEILFVILNAAKYVVKQRPCTTCPGFFEGTKQGEVLKYKLMKSKLPVSGIMTRRIASVKPEDNMEHVRQIFEQHGFHHIPVVEGSKLAGIVSYTDYLRVISDYFSTSEGNSASKKLLHSLTVKEMMTQNPVCLRPDDTVETALGVFRMHPFHALPVTEDDGKLVGILTTFDVMKFFEDAIAPEHSYTE